MADNLQIALAEVERLRAAIRSHRDQRGDDRCWMDDELLYAALPEGYTPPARDSAVELERCRQYIACRHDPQTVYVSPQRRIEELEAEVAGLRKANALLLAGMESQTELMDGLKQQVRRITLGK